MSKPMHLTSPLHLDACSSYFSRRWPPLKSLVQGHLLSSEAIVRQARHFGAHSSKSSLAICLCCLQGGCWAIIDVRPASSCDRRLCCKQQLRASRYTLRTHALPDRHPI